MRVLRGLVWVLFGKNSVYPQREADRPEKSSLEVIKNSDKLTFTRMRVNVNLEVEYTYEWVSNSSTIFRKNRKRSRKHQKDAMLWETHWREDGEAVDDSEGCRIS